MYKGHLSKDGLYCLNEFCNIYLQNNPVNNAVNITPTDDNTND